MVVVVVVVVWGEGEGGGGGGTLNRITYYSASHGSYKLIVIWQMHKHT